MFCLHHDRRTPKRYFHKAISRLSDTLRLKRWWQNSCHILKLLNVDLFFYMYLIKKTFDYVLKNSIAALLMYVILAQTNLYYVGLVYWHNIWIHCMLTKLSPTFNIKFKPFGIYLQVTFVYLYLYFQLYFECFAVIFTVFLDMNKTFLI